MRLTTGRERTRGTRTRMPVQSREQVQRLRQLGDRSSSRARRGACPTSASDKGAVAQLFRGCVWSRSSSTCCRATASGALRGCALRRAQEYGCCLLDLSAGCRRVRWRGGPTTCPSSRPPSTSGTRAMQRRQPAEVSTRPGPARRTGGSCRARRATRPRRAGGGGGPRKTQAVRGKTSSSPGDSYPGPEWITLGPDLSVSARPPLPHDHRGREPTRPGSWVTRLLRRPAHRSGVGLGGVTGAAEWRGMPCEWLLIDGSSLIFRAYYGALASARAFADRRERGRRFPGQAGAAGRRPPAPPAGDRRGLGMAAPVASGPDRGLQGPPGR